MEQTKPTDRRIELVPQKFCFQDRYLYPHMNVPDFEYWLFLNTKQNDVPEDWCYLPITFTAYYKEANYGQDKNKIEDLQLYLNTLDKKKKYYCVVQYDDGILNDLTKLNIKVFSMAGGNRKDYGLPLICQPSNIKTTDKPRDIFASFVGRITHPIRQEMISHIPYGMPGRYYTSTYHHQYPDYCDLLTRSIFSLCPRGYSGTSFKIAESLQHGAIPVYLSDTFYPVHNLDFNDFGIKIDAKDAKRVDETLSAISEDEIKAKQQKLSDVYDVYYTFSGNKELILESLD